MKEKTTSHLGSIWKLFSHSYLLENNIKTSPYLCTGNNPDERFCCEKGKSIDAPLALAKSCGPFYEQTMKNISASDWNRFWKDKGVTYAWMTKEKMKDHREVPVSEILSVLDTMKSFPAHKELLHDLAGVWLRGTLQDSFPALGLAWFSKTWTWGSEKKKKFIGGVAGWSRSGESFWVKGQGTSRELILSVGKEISEKLPNSGLSGTKVKVNFFTRYPIASVTRLPSGEKVSSGNLSGSYRVHFSSGTTVDIQSSGELTLINQKITGVFDRDDYVARVLEREGTAHDGEASRALAILIRTYLVDHARTADGIFEIDDTSSLQRVSATPPTPLALKTAEFSAGLILEGKTNGHNGKIWKEMKAQASRGKNFLAILRSMAPKTKLSYLRDGRSSSCDRLANVENYLRRSVTKWHRELVRYPGYEEVSKVEVCKMNYPKPYSDLKANRIYLHFDDSEESRTTLAHEYLHLSFKNHPNTTDEQFIETLARKISGVKYE